MRAKRDSCLPISGLEPIEQEQWSVSNLMKDRVATTEKGFICLICGSSVVHEASMRRHLSDIHLHSHLRYRCPLCKKIYKNKNSLANHLYSYHKDVKGLDINKCICR